MDRGLQLLQRFRGDMLDQSAYIRRLTYALDVTVSPMQDRMVTITITWKNKPPFEKKYTVKDICGNTYLLPPLAWRIEGPPCQRAKILAQEALSTL